MYQQLTGTTHNEHINQAHYAYLDGPQALQALEFIKQNNATKGKESWNNYCNGKENPTEDDEEEADAGPNKGESKHDKHNDTHDQWAWQQGKQKQYQARKQHRASQRMKERLTTTTPKLEAEGKTSDVESDVNADDEEEDNTDDDNGPQARKQAKDCEPIDIRVVHEEHDNQAVPQYITIATDELELQETDKQGNDVLQPSNLQPDGYLYAGKEHTNPWRPAHS